MSDDINLLDVLKTSQEAATAGNEALLALTDFAKSIIADVEGKLRAKDEHIARLKAMLNLRDNAERSRGDRYKEAYEQAIGKSLKDELEGWTDTDLAMFYLARLIGIVPVNSKFQDHKGMCWTNNPKGNMLHDLLVVLVKAGYLEQADDYYRWKEQE